MPLPQDVRYSYDDLLSWPENERYELYDGFPVAMASPSIQHQSIVGELFAQFHAFLKGKSCKVYVSPVDVRLFETSEDAPSNVDTVLIPDLLVICDQSKVDRRGIHGAPDLIVEVLSDGTKRYDLHTKRRLYEMAGVREYWIVDPERRIVQVYTLEQERYKAAEIYTALSTVPISVLKGCNIDMSTVFPE